MKTVSTVSAVREIVCSWHSQGLKVGFVPTMGFLHDGHLSLMRLALTKCDRLVVSIFVNPLQFSPNEDLDTYPRDEDGDADKCANTGVSLLYVPSDAQGEESFYPDEFTTIVSVSDVTSGLCGATRPTHFQGVTTVVARLFGIVQPSLAVFGEKDYQQLAVIRRMVRDLAMPIEVIGAPLVRENDGLAMSSRNSRLSAEGRKRAVSLSQALLAIINSSESSVASLLKLGRIKLDVDRLDYLEIVDPVSLDPIYNLDRSAPNARVLVAGVIDGVRLIDNMEIK
jgi:pantoate--beta-alanine ligase